MYLVFTHKPDESYCRWLRFLLFTCVLFFKCWLTPLCVDSARVFWASFCFRLVSISQMEWSVTLLTAAWPSLIMLSEQVYKSHIEGTHFLFVFDVCVYLYTSFYMCVAGFYGSDLRKGLWEVFKCTFVYDKVWLSKVAFLQLTGHYNPGMVLTCETDSVKPPVITNIQKCRETVRVLFTKY